MYKISAKASLRGLLWTTYTNLVFLPICQSQQLVEGLLRRMKSGACNGPVVLPLSDALRALQSFLSKVLQVDERLQNHIRSILEGLCVDSLRAEFIQSPL